MCVGVLSSIRKQAEQASQQHSLRVSAAFLYLQVPVLSSCHFLKMDYDLNVQAKQTLPQAGFAQDLLTLSESKEDRPANLMKWN